MARSILIVFIAILQFSCSRDQPNTNATDHQVVADSLQGSNNTSVLVDHTQAGIQTPDDSTVYVGRIYSIGDDEVYTSVYYWKELDDSEYLDHQAAPVDSVIYEDDEIRRSRLPISIAQHHFNLSGLQKLSIYDDAGYVGEARFLRVELLEDMIESQFIAVFRLMNPLRSNPRDAYCISSSHNDGLKSTDIRIRKIEDETLTENILKKMKISSEVYNESHVEILPDKLYSGVSFLDSGAFLFETIGDRTRIVQEITENYSITDITPVRLEVNGKPVLLLDMGVNETDMMWTSLVAFSGKRYEFVDGNRLQP